MGVKTDEYLSAIFADSFKREVEADESVWRSLPFFAAVLGLALAILPSIYRALVVVDRLGWKVAAYSLFAMALLDFGLAGYWFWQIVRLRQYRYPPYDDELLAYAQQLQAFYEDGDLTSVERDEAVREDVRQPVLRELAGATANNRRNNAAKANARSRVLLFVVVGFLLAFLCEATILSEQLFPL